MHVLMRADERTQEPLGVWSLPEAGTPDACYLHDARQAADDRLALHAKGMPWREWADQVGPRADLDTEALQGSGAL